MTYSNPEVLKRIYEERICVICGEFFYVRKKKVRRARSSLIIRPRSSKTCSRKCAREKRKYRNKSNVG